MKLQKNMKTTVIRRILEYLLVFCIILEFNTPYLIFPEVKRMIQVFPIFILLGLLKGGKTKCDKLSYST